MEDYDSGTPTPKVVYLITPCVCKSHVVSPIQYMDTCVSTFTTVFNLESNRTPSTGTPGDVLRNRKKGTKGDGVSGREVDPVDEEKVSVKDGVTGCLHKRLHEKEPFWTGPVPFCRHDQHETWLFPHPTFKSMTRTVDHSETGSDTDCYFPFGIPLGLWVFPVGSVSL